MQQKQEQNKTLSEKQSSKFTLYSLLDLDKNATVEQIKKQYRVLALKYHPDKNQGDEESKKMFQKIAEAHQILSDPEKRRVYDQTGEIDEESQFQEAFEFFRHLFPKVSEQDIVDFEKRYRYGQMEEEDLINFYNEHNGDVHTILESIPLSVNEDIPRFISFYQQKFNSKELKKYKIFNTSKEEIILLKNESRLAESQRKLMKGLESQILSKRGNFEDMMKGLEEKYAPKQRQRKPQQYNENVEVKIKKKLKKIQMK